MADSSTVVSFLASMTSWFTPTAALFIFVNLVIGTIAIFSHRKPHPNHDQQGPNDPPQLFRAPSLLDRVKSANFPLYKFPQYSNPEEETREFPPTEPVCDSNPVDPYPPQLQRGSSLLERVRSLKFTSVYKSQQPYPETETEVYESPPQLQRGPSLLERVRSLKFTFVYKSQQPYPETETEVIDTSDSELDSDPKQGLDPNNHPKRTKSETKKTKPKAREIVKRSASEKSMTVADRDEKTEAVERRRPETTRAERTSSSGDGDEGVDAKADDFINRFRNQLKLQRLNSLLRYKE